MTINKTITLNNPVTVDGEKIEKLEMRPPKVRDRLVAEKTKGGAEEKELTFIANLCSVGPDVLPELDLADYLKLQEAVNDFLS